MGVNVADLMASFKKSDPKQNIKSDEVKPSQATVQEVAPVVANEPVAPAHTPVNDIPEPKKVDDFAAMFSNGPIRTETQNTGVVKASRNPLSAVEFEDTVMNYTPTPKAEPRPEPTPAPVPQTIGFSSGPSLFGSGPALPSKQMATPAPASVPAPVPAQTYEQVQPKPTAKMTVNDDIFSGPIGAVKYNFDYSQEAEASPKEIFCIYGDKGAGKTVLAMSMPGKKACLSFDKKSAMTKKYIYNNDDSITVYDCVQFLDQSSQQVYLDSAKKCFDYTIGLLQYLRNEVKPDWVIIDGVEIMQTLCEMVMRKNNGLMPYQGITNRNIWKERRLLVNQIHNNAVDAGIQGVIYTTYTEFKDIAIENGEIQERKEIPKWIENILFATDTVIRVDIETKKEGRRFVALVENSKTGLKDNTKYDITGTGFDIILKDRKLPKNFVMGNNESNINEG